MVTFLSFGDWGFENRSLSNASDVVESVGEGHVRNELREQVPRIPGAQGGENKQ